MIETILLITLFVCGFAAVICAVGLIADFLDFLFDNNNEKISKFASGMADLSEFAIVTTLGCSALSFLLVAVDKMLF